MVLRVDYSELGFKAKIHWSDAETLGNIANSINGASDAAENAGIDFKNDTVGGGEVNNDGKAVLESHAVGAKNLFQQIVLALRDAIEVLGNGVDESVNQFANTDDQAGVATQSSADDIADVQAEGIPTGTGSGDSGGGTPQGAARAIGERLNDAVPNTGQRNFGGISESDRGGGSVGHSGGGRNIGGISDPGGGSVGHPGGVRIFGGPPDSDSSGNSGSSDAGRSIGEAIHDATSRSGAHDAVNNISESMNQTAQNVDSVQYADQYEKSFDGANLDTSGGDYSGNVSGDFGVGEQPAVAEHPDTAPVEYTETPAASEHSDSSQYSPNVGQTPTDGGIVPYPIEPTPTNVCTCPVAPTADVGFTAQPEQPAPGVLSNECANVLRGGFLEDAIASAPAYVEQAMTDAPGFVNDSFSQLHELNVGGEGGSSMMIRDALSFAPPMVQDALVGVPEFSAMVAENGVSGLVDVDFLTGGAFSEQMTAATAQILDSNFGVDMNQPILGLEGMPSGFDLANRYFDIMGEEIASTTARLATELDQLLSSGGSLRFSALA